MYAVNLWGRSFVVSELLDATQTILVHYNVLEVCQNVTYVTVAKAVKTVKTLLFRSYTPSNPDPQEITT